MYFKIIINIDIVTPSLNKERYKLYSFKLNFNLKDNIKKSVNQIEKSVNQLKNPGTITISTRELY